MTSHHLISRLRSISSVNLRKYENNRCQKKNENYTKYLEGTIVVVGSRLIICGIANFLSRKTFPQQAPRPPTFILDLLIIARHHKPISENSCKYTILLTPGSITIHSKILRNSISCPKGLVSHSPHRLKARETHRLTARLEGRRDFHERIRIEAVEARTQRQRIGADMADLDPIAGVHRLRQPERP